MLSCEEANKFMDAYLENELSFFKRLSFKFHIMICKRCRVYFNQYKISYLAVKNNRNALRHNLNTEMPAELRDTILKHLPKN